MKKNFLIALLAIASTIVNAAIPDSLKKDLEDYDYLVGFIENNYAPFDAIMQKGYKREYKSMKKQTRAQLCKGESNLEKATTDYAMWFYRQFDRHIGVDAMAFQMAWQLHINEAVIKTDSTVVEVPGTFEYDPKPVSCKVDSLTWLIRVPTCSPELYEWTINALQQFDESDCENLIIDVRENDGGNDGVWNRYYDMLYDHPNKPFVCWFRNTPENRANWQSDNERMKNFIATCESSKKKFVKWVEKAGDTGRKSTTRIKKAAILVDIITGSAAERIAEFAQKYSNRAKVYGIGNTFGSDLTGNCREGYLPNSQIDVHYATSVDSGFYEKDFSEGLGIVPDVIIPLPMARKLTDNIDEWVLWVAKDLKKK